MTKSSFGRLAARGIMGLMAAAAQAMHGGFGGGNGVFPKQPYVKQPGKGVERAQARAAATAKRNEGVVWPGTLTRQQRRNIDRKLGKLNHAQGRIEAMRGRKNGDPRPGSTYHANRKRDQTATA